MEAEAASGGRGGRLKVVGRGGEGRHSGTGVHRVQGVRLLSEAAPSGALHLGFLWPGGGRRRAPLCGKSTFGIWQSALLSYCIPPPKILFSEFHDDTPEKSEVAPSESTFRFSELSAVPIEASDSSVSSSDARGSRVRISHVRSSLQKQTFLQGEH